jgi:hypothetical protein
MVKWGQIESITMSAEHPSEPYISSKQETKFVPATFESPSALENMSAKDLSMQKQQLEAKIQKFQELDKQQVIAKGGNTYLQSSESDAAIQANKELELITEAITKKITTIQDAAKDTNVSYTPEDVLELYAIFMPDSKANNQQALLGIMDRITSLIEAIPKADGKNMPILSADELMSISGLKIPKNDPKYTTYKKIIAISLIDGLRDTTKFTGKDDRREILEVETAKL